MSDPSHIHSGAPQQVERGELVGYGPGGHGGQDGEPQVETVSEPAKVMRIGSMVKQLLEEVRQAPLDEASRERLAEIYERSIVELSEALYPLLLSLRRLHNSVEDTHALAQSEAYEAALVVYRSARDNDTDGTMAAAIGEMKSRFNRKSSKKPPVTPPTPAPQP